MKKYFRLLYVAIIVLLMSSCNKGDNILDSSPLKPLSQKPDLSYEDAKEFILDYNQQLYNEDSKRNIIKSEVIKNDDNNIRMYAFEYEKGGMSIVSAYIGKSLVLVESDIAKIDLSNNSCQNNIIKQYIPYLDSIANDRDIKPFIIPEKNNVSLKWTRKFISADTFCYLGIEYPWAQEGANNIFGYYCPSGKPIGCGPLALAMILRYYEPDNGTDWSRIDTDYWSDYYINSDPETSNWGYRAKWLAEIRRNAMSGSDFGNTWTFPSKLESACKHYGFTNASNVEWFWDKMYTELSNQRPMIALIGADDISSTISKSHWFVIHGYRKVDYLYNGSTHLYPKQVKANFGWGNDERNTYWYWNFQPAGYGQSVCLPNRIIRNLSKPN